jgi:16S rRNA (guanine527-N7)-methyltransferase
MNAHELLKKSLNELTINYSENQINAFITYLTELKKWNKTYNLTSLKTDKDIVIKHFIDSLLYLNAIPEGIAKVADLGSGAGFPGIPLKIIRPDLDMVLIEPSRKKASFLRHMVRQLNLSSIVVLEERVEHIGNDYIEAFDVTVSRATFSVSKSLDAAWPFIKKGGMLVLSKGPKVISELKELEKSSYAQKVSQTFHKIKLPLSEIERNIVVLTRKR